MGGGDLGLIFCRRILKEKSMTLHPILFFLHLPSHRQRHHAQVFNFRFLFLPDVEDDDDVRTPRQASKYIVIIKK